MNLTKIMSCHSIGRASIGHSHHASISYHGFAESVSGVRGRIDVAEDVAFERVSDATNCAPLTHMRLEEQESVSSPTEIWTDQTSLARARARLWKKALLYQSRTIQDTFLGYISVRSAQKRLQWAGTESMADRTGDDQCESETWITVRPASWLMTLGIKYGLHLNLQRHAFQGWRHSLRSFCLVRDDAPIFEFCKKGNVSGVRQLLCNGEASVGDTNSQGETHFT